MVCRYWTHIRISVSEETKIRTTQSKDRSYGMRKNRVLVKSVLEMLIEKEVSLNIKFAERCKNCHYCGSLSQRRARCDPNLS